MRKSKAMEQRLVQLATQVQALRTQVAVLSFDVHTLKSQKKIEQMGHQHVPSHHKE